MENDLAEAIDILKRLSEEGVEKALAVLREIKAEIDKKEKTSVPDCINCGSKHVVRNGHKHMKQAYLCRNCGKSFVDTTKTTLFQSHFGEAMWKQVIRDTVGGISIDDTAASLDLHHETVFNMRHKILYCLEQEERMNPTQFEGVCELDETYILENYKGSELPPDFWRQSRKHGAVAVKRGLSDEYICVCAGVEREGNALSMSVNRATAGTEDIRQVFGNRISGKTIIVSDGSKGYGVLEEDGKCAVFNAKEAQAHGVDFFNINTVNNFHSFIKERNRNARGFATKYLNRYNALFSKIYRTTDAVVDDIYKMLCDRNERNQTILKTKTQDLLEI